MHNAETIAAAPLTLQLAIQHAAALDLEWLRTEALDNGETVDDMPHPSECRDFKSALDIIAEVGIGRHVLDALGFPLGTYVELDTRGRLQDAITQAFDAVV